LLGGTAADYLGKSDSDLFPGFLSRQLQANDAEVLSLGAGKTFEEEFVLDARQRTFSTRKFPLFGADGEVAGVCLMATDVTAQRRTEFALERIALSVSSATGPEVFDLIVANLAGALGVQFAFIARIVEREPETLQALSAWYDGNFVEPPCYTSAGTPCADVLAQGFTFISDMLGQTHPTDAMLAEFNFRSYAGFPLTGPGGESVGVLSVCHSGELPDASLVEHLLRIFSVRASAELQRAETESALRASEASYRTMFESAEDPILVHDMHTGAIVDMNHKACETFGYTRDEMLQIGCGHLSSGIPPYTSDAAAALLRKAAEGQPQRVEWQMRNRDGSVHWDEVTLNRVTLSGVDRILAVTRDVTDRRQREADLRRSERRLRATIEARWTRSS
jgi:PAS domain S-box-containing protein